MAGGKGWRGGGHGREPVDRRRLQSGTRVRLGGDLQGSAVTRAQTVKRMQQVWGEQCGETETPRARSSVYRPKRIELFAEITGLGGGDTKVMDG